MISRPCVRDCLCIQAARPFTPGAGSGEALWDAHWSFFTGSTGPPTSADAAPGALDAVGVDTGKYTGNLPLLVMRVDLTNWLL